MHWKALEGTPLVVLLVITIGPGNKPHNDCPFKITLVKYPAGFVLSGDLYFFLFTSVLPILIVELALILPPVIVSTNPPASVRSRAQALTTAISFDTGGLSGVGGGSHLNVT